MIDDTNISISNVKALLGESTNSIGGLCSSTKINAWSPYAPCSISELFPAKSELPAAHWKVVTGLDGNSSHSFIEYNPPTGGSSSPYRLGDFRGYIHDIANPTISVTTTAPSESTRSFYITLTYDYRTASNNATLYDFSAANSVGTYKYYAIITYRTNIIKLPLTTSNGYEYTASTTVTYEQQTYTYVVGLVKARSDGTVGSVTADGVIRFTNRTNGVYSYIGTGSGTVANYVDISTFDTYGLLQVGTSNVNLDVSSYSVSFTQPSSTTTKSYVDIVCTGYDGLEHNVYLTISKKNSNGTWTLLVPRYICTTIFLSRPHISFNVTNNVTYESQNMLWVFELAEETEL